MAKKKKSTEIVELPSEFYSRMENKRGDYEDRAKLIAKLTLPYLIREDSDSGTTAMKDSNNQSYGGRLINTLKAKMGMALLPPATSSFRYVPKPEELVALTKGNKNNNAKVYQVLSTNVNTVNKEIELQQIRNSLFDMIAQLLVVGSVVVEKKESKGMVIHPLLSFTVELDAQGKPFTICIIEKTLTLPDGVEIADNKKMPADGWELYTMCVKDKTVPKGDGGWIVIQEIEGNQVGTEQKYASDIDLPFRYLGWTWMTGDYCHRPYAEDYYKDLEQLDNLAKLLTQGSVIAAKMLLFVNERGGRTRKDEVAESANGDVIDGSADDVTTLKTEKNFDFQMPMEREQSLKKELSSAFLMNESVTRDAERVTAAEISYMAQQLESSTLAGVYSKMANDWSKWMVHQVMLELGIKFESIEVEILTGLDALGRSQEAQKLDNVMQRAEALGIRHWFNDDELVNRYTSFESVDTTNLVKTPDEVATEMAKQQAAAAEQAGAEAAATAGGQALGTQAAGQPAQ